MGGCFDLSHFAISCFICLFSLALRMTKANTFDFIAYLLFRRKLRGRGRRARYGGFDIEPENKGWDRKGHGTHCAGIAGGRCSGVAKAAKLFSIRVLNAKGRGSKANIMKGMIHALNRHLTRVGK